MRALRRVLVVGAGRAGVAAAEELRRQGFGGEIQVMCDEPEAPYDRPSCSKGLLTGHKRPADARMPVQDGLAIQWLMGRRAAHLDPKRRVVTADTDEEFRYDGLVIATGARPVWPKDWPTKNEAGLYTLHGINDAWQLRKALRRAKRVVVVGGGLTGCEVAYSVRSMARECALVDSKQHLMVRALGEVVGGYVTDEIARDGVDLQLGRRVASVERYRRGWAVVLDDGSAIETDVVVATVGERPDTKWLADSGFDISDGVLCDENLRVVGGEDVVACGTVARWPNLRYGSEPRRVGQWIMALEQGRAAASALLGSDHPSRPAALVPRYWSEQFGLRIQVCGDVTADHRTEVAVDRRRPGSRHPARHGVLVGYYRDGEQVGVAAVNRVRAFTKVARQILAAPARLAEPPELLPPAPGRRSVESRMIAAAPASAPPRGRHTIDVPASAVRDVSYEPYPPGPARAPVPTARRALAATAAPPPEPEPEWAARGTGYQPQYHPQPRPIYEPPRYAPVYQASHPPERYGYQQPPGYVPPGHPAPGYPPAEYAAPPQYPAPPGYPPEPGYTPEPGYAPQPAYGYEPGYQPAYPPHYAPQNHQPAGYPPAEYAPPEYAGPGYGPPAHYPPEYGPPGYPPPQYGWGQSGPGYAPGGHPPPGGYPEQRPAPPEPTQPRRAAADWPVSPAVHPVSPPSRPVSPSPRPQNPRDRFTSEFAAIR